MDAVDEILQPWRRERPDLDVRAMGVIGRLKRVHGVLNRETSKTFAAYGLNPASFDVLATLRRSGAPYSLVPGELLRTMMVTSGTMTHRIDQLVKARLVQRERHPEDGRSVVITLTASGLELIDRVMGDHVETQNRLLSRLTVDQGTELNGLLTKLLRSFDPPH
ncbi:MAG: MarR family transcriptional regulator [Planctomycetota bacterium]|nr:MarR family transcriptional regulator [Planctomycetota bacterium]